MTRRIYSLPRATAPDCLQCLYPSNQAHRLYPLPLMRVLFIYLYRRIGIYVIVYCILLVTYFGANLHRWTLFINWRWNKFNRESGKENMRRAMYETYLSWSSEDCCWFFFFAMLMVAWYWQITEYVFDIDITKSIWKLLNICIVLQLYVWPVILLISTDNTAETKSMLIYEYNLNFLKWR